MKQIALKWWHSWHQRREWRAEFRQRGLDQVREMVRLAAYYHNREKQHCARQWIARQERRQLDRFMLVLTLIGTAVALIISVLIMK